ncbi:MAG: hypothetical protein OEM21_10445 [Nitrosopumilus sp.]|nr:hypothetical protein [Nitrosopumilus sp.]
MSGIEYQMVELIKDELKSSITSILEDSNINEIEDVKIVSSWYHEAGKSKEDFVLKALNIIVEKIMAYIPQELASQLIDEIRINTNNQETDIKFNFNFDLEPIKPFTQFIKKINDLTALKIKTIFQIDCSGIMQDIEIQVMENKKILNLNNLEMNLKLSLIQLGVIGIKFPEPKKLGEKTISLDLSTIRMNY